MGLSSKGFIEPWPEQSDGISYLGSGRDILVNCSRGKTTLAIIGLLQEILESVKATQGIIVYPSIQAAQKAFKLCTDLTTEMDIKSVLLVSEETLGQHEIRKTDFAQLVLTVPWILQKVQSVNSGLYDSTKLLVLDDAKKLLELNSFKSLILKVSSQLSILNFHLPCSL